MKLLKRAAWGAALVFGALAAGTTGIASAQDFPSKPIKLIVPYPPGGAVDPVARLYAQHLAQTWGVPVVVHNRPGAGTIVGLNEAAKSPNDGHTVVVTGVTHTVLPYLANDPPFDAGKDFTFMGFIGHLPLGIAVHPKHNVKTLEELIALAKRNPGKLTYSTSGAGTMPHLGGELMARMAGIDVRHIPYKGSNPALLAATAGETDFILDSILRLRALSKDGRLMLLASGSDKRLTAMPQLPTIAETLPGFGMAGWLGIVGPKGISPEVSHKWAAEVKRITALPDVKAKLGELMNYADDRYSTPEAFRGLYETETTKWGKIIQEVGIPKIY